MVKKFITPSILVLAAVLSWWYIKTLDKSLAQKPAVTTAAPDYIMYDTVSTVLDESGEPKHRLQTTHLTHFPEDNRTELQDARLTLHQQDGSLWSVKANRGTLFQETEQIYLTGDVVIERPNTDTLPAPDMQKPTSEAGIKIETDRLHIDPNLQTAQTEAPVVIRNREARVNAVGMKANLQTKSVELLANVRGIYAPQYEQAH